MKPITAVVSAAGHIDLLSLGHSPATNSHALHRQFNGQAWTGAWDDAGGVFLSTLAATSRGDAFVDAFGLGTDGSMFHRSWNGQAWAGGWEGLGGTSPVRRRLCAPSRARWMSSPWAPTAC